MPTRKAPRLLQSVADGASDWSAADVLEAAEGMDQLADFALRLRTGQRCEGACANDASWSAVAVGTTHFACDLHLTGLLDRNYVWFLHPLPMGS